MCNRFIGNYHTHTCRCQHAGGTPMEFAAVASDNDLQELGISDHMPYEDDRFYNRMRMREFPDYLQDIRNAQQVYPHLKIYRALECEYLPTNRAYLEKHIGWKSIGKILCGYVTQPGDTEGKKELKEAYELGRFIK